APAGGPGTETALPLPSRGVGYAGPLAIPPLSAGIAAAARFLGRRLSTPPAAGAAAVTGALAIAVVIVLSPLGPDRWVASELEPPYPQVQRAAAELRRTVRDGARFVTQRDYPAEVSRTGVLIPPTWLAWAAVRDSPNGGNPQSSS